MAEFESAHGTVTSSGLDGFDDVAVGHWTDAAARTGVTVVVLPEVRMRRSTGCVPGAALKSRSMRACASSHSSSASTLAKAWPRPW